GTRGRKALGARSAGSDAGGSLRPPNAGRRRGRFSNHALPVAGHEGALGRLSGDRDSSRRSEYSPNASVNALCTLVQTGAAELRDSGVTVNALLPTTVDTPQVRSWYGDAEAH